MTTVIQSWCSRAISSAKLPCALDRMHCVRSRSHALRALSIACIACALDRMHCVRSRLHALRALSIACIAYETKLMEHQVLKDADEKMLMEHALRSKGEEITAE